MPHDRRFRFGTQVHTAATGREWADTARQVEGLGYSTLFLPDHFGDQLAPVPALAAAAAVTTELRVGALVFDNDYRHPVVLAKEAATIDVISEGRFELGLGAGWMNSDYEQSGIRHDPAGVRVDRMAEGIAVLKGLFAPGAFSFTGEHYTVTGLEGLPKPVQQPGPPLLVGGGAKRVLGIAAREADIVGINPSIRSGAVDADAARNGAAEETDRKLAWVREAAGDRFDDIELNMLAFAVVVTDDRPGTLAMMAPMFGLDPDGLDDYPHALIGTEAQIAEQLQAARERWGVSYWVVQADALEPLAPVVARLAGT
ncbi:MAG TPA: TIGR03621 family F420-dependent LLM class oxidoreductase [Acidimicrobiales bacterium]|nr:TIGR03621 family F420-dependent LLM class oxidoreductase [Acidimicrobiales bacterium]